MTGAGCALWQGRPVTGTATVSSVVVAATTAAVTPATVTVVVAALRKFAPVMVATDPGERVAGVIAMIDGETAPSGGTTTRASEPETPSLSAVTVVVPHDQGH